MKTDPTGAHWRQGVACGQSGTIAGCQSETGTTWHYPSDTEKTADEVKKTCSEFETLVPGNGGTPPAIIPWPTKEKADEGGW